MNFAHPRMNPDCPVNPSNPARRRHGFGPRLLRLALAMCAGTALAGPPKAPPAPVQPKPDENPLSFFDGRLVFDFEERLRFEYRGNNFDFNDALTSPTDDSWWLQRARLGVKFAPVEWLAFYAQAQSSFEFDSNRPSIPGALGAEGDNEIDLFQGYVRLGDKNLNATIGRQIMSYGDERLIGGFDWNNLGRTFDAVKVHYGTDSWNVEAFASSVVVPKHGDFDQSDLFDGNGTDRNQVFSGLYYSSTGLLPVQVTEIYALELHEEYPAGDTDFVTLGTRMKADPKKLGGFDYDTEMAAQFGNVKGDGLQAFAGHWGAGYNWLKSAWKPRLGIEYNYATGDHDPRDGTVETFQNLFPTNHPLYGTMDLFSWRNLSNPGLSFSVQPVETVKVKLDYNAFWLANTSDNWYRAGGAPVLPIHPGANNYVGSEIDINASWKITKNVIVAGGYGHFFNGKYADGTAASSDADFAYAQVTIKF